ncbi:phosphoribosyl-AMP cyclohydrolase [Brevundimonas sp. TWP1-2-1b1]|uniref:phosphoribosyl-AMP cyclohydrolase n=1 Tax=unclassified Brevundimonas TaxID=2622653 RepID=UPI003CEF4DA4
MKFTSPLAAMALALPLMAGALPALAHANDTYASASLNTSAVAPITTAEVEAAQRAWGDALVAISTEYERNGQEAAKRLAGQVIDAAYGYDLGPVAFKPTLAAAPQTFRTTREGALAYFVGGDARFAADTGFALKSWRAYEIDNAAIVINGTTAISTGNVMFTNADGVVTTVDKTWGYVRDAEGKLRIVLHHSSLPYSAN